MTALETEALLGDGRRIPVMGFGTYLLPADRTAEIVSTALEVGYRHVDTARFYRNEAGVGAAVAASGIPRERLWITTKLPIGATTLDDVRRSVDASVAALGTHVDLYLIHWPRPSLGAYPVLWRGLQRAQSEGAVRSIGVSNFHAGQLDRILGDGGARPTVNQIEIHPHLANAALVERCVREGIAVQAWSPLGAGSVLRDPTIRAIAEEVGATAAQVVLAWHLRHGHLVVPKTVSRERMIENLGARDLALSDDQLARIDRLDRGAAGRTGPDPERL